jgi:hypothetical protein
VQKQEKILVVLYTRGAINTSNTKKEKLNTKKSKNPATVWNNAKLMEEFVKL